MKDTGMQDLNEHILTGYDDDLNELNKTLAELGGHVEAMVADSVKSIKKRDSKLATDVIARDKHANSLQEKVDEDVIRLFALRHPLAADLRRVISASKVANDLERIGDLAESMSRRALSINAEERIALAKGIVPIGKLVRIQLKDALDALMRSDENQAIQVWLGDSDVDEMYNSYFRELLTYMMEDSRTITSCTGLLFAAKNLERIADHATNIAECVYYTVTGKAIVHSDEVKAELG